MTATRRPQRLRSCGLNLTADEGEEASAQLAAKSQYITSSPTRPSAGCSKAPGTVPATPNPSDS